MNQPNLFALETKPEAPAPELPNNGELRFDGGCIGNPGAKYGSFQFTLNGELAGNLNRFQLGHGTNNEAEWEALIIGLDALLNHCETKRIDPRTISLRIITDSMIIVWRLKPRKKQRKPDKDARGQAMQTYANQSRERLVLLGAWQIEWQGRGANVEAFGH